MTLCSSGRRSCVEHHRRTLGLKIEGVVALIRELAGDQHGR